VSASSSTSSTDDGGPDERGSATLLEVGRITRAHGLRGDVVIAPITNRAERFQAGAQLHAGDRVVEITKSRAQGDQFVVHLAGVDDRNAAEALRGTLLRAEALGDAPDGELWVHELIGCDVVEADGTPRGRIEAVQDNPAHDLLVLDTGALVPMVFVVDHDVLARRVVIDTPEGLFDVNAS
jgi:16S rRNA processing protein RimM